MRGNTTAIGYEAKNDESTMEKAGKSNMPSRIHITFYSLEVFLISTPCMYMFSCPRFAIPFSGVLKSANCSTDTTTAPLYKDSNKNFNDR